MAVFEIVEHSSVAPDVAWQRLTEWPRHAERVPFTTITVRTAPPTRRGTVFVAHTGLGRAGFDDPMEIVEWRPPVAGVGGSCRIEKRGTVITGWAELSVDPEGTGSRAVWREDAGVRMLPRLADPVTVFAARRLFGGVLRHLLADPVRPTRPTRP